MAERGAKTPKLSETVHHVNVQEQLDAALKSEAASQQEQATEDADHSRTDKGLHDSRDSSTDTGTGDGRSDVESGDTKVSAEVKAEQAVVSDTDTDSRAAHNALIDQQHPRGENTSAGGQVAAGEQAAQDQIGQALTQSIGHFTTGAEFGVDGPQGQHGDSAPSDEGKPDPVTLAFNRAVGDLTKGLQGAGTDADGNAVFGANLGSDFETKVTISNDIVQKVDSFGTVTTVARTENAVSVLVQDKYRGETQTTTTTIGNTTQVEVIENGKLVSRTTTTTNKDGSQDIHRDKPDDKSAGGGTAIPAQNDDVGDPHRAQELLHQLDPTGHLAAERAAQHAGPGSGSGHGSGNSDPSQDPSNSDEARTEAGSTPLVKDLLSGDRGGGDPNFDSGVGAAGTLPAGGVTNPATGGRGDPTQDSLSPIRTHGPDEREHQTVKTDPTAHGSSPTTAGTSTEAPPVDVTSLHDHIATPAHGVPDSIHPGGDTDFGSGQRATIQATPASQPFPSSHASSASGSPDPSAGSAPTGGPSPVERTEPGVGALGPHSSSDGPPPAADVTSLQDHIATPAHGVPDGIHVQASDTTGDDHAFGAGVTSGDPPSRPVVDPAHLDVHLHVGPPPIGAETSQGESAPQVGAPTTIAPAGVPDTVHPHEPGATSDDTDFGAGPSVTSTPHGETSADAPTHSTGAGPETSPDIHLSPDHVAPLPEPVVEHEPFHLPDHLDLHDPNADDDGPDDD